MSKVDQANIDRALKRAAQNAVHGSREAQTGRFTATDATVSRGKNKTVSVTAKPLR